MRDDDVADILTREPELLDLVDSGFEVAEDGSEKVAQRSDPSGGLSAQSCEPKPVSISTKPLSVSTSST